MKVEKIKVTSNSRQLKASWTVTLLPDEDTLWGKGLEDRVAKLMQEKIDWEILSTLLIEQGWTSVTLTKEFSSEMSKWAYENAKGTFKHNSYNHWVFEKQDDAAWFILKWK